MKPLRIKHYLMITLSFAALLPVCALAAGSATIAVNGHQTQVDWYNGMIRVDPDNSNDHVILSDGHVYSIATSDGQAKVTDMTGMVQLLRRMIQNNSSMPIPFDATIDTV